MILLSSLFTWANDYNLSRNVSKRFQAIAPRTCKSYDETYSIIDMLTAGAKGCLLKDAHKTDIIDAITTVNKNQHYYCKTTEQRLKKLITGNIYNPVARIKKLKLLSILTLKLYLKKPKN